jgi:hypothetical protein
MRLYLRLAFDECAGRQTFRIVEFGSPASARRDGDANGFQDAWTGSFTSITAAAAVNRNRWFGRLVFF